jgi:hypothetical protein
MRRAGKGKETRKSGLLDVVDRVLHLHVELFTKTNERVEGTLLSVQKECALWLHELTGHVHTLEVNLRSCFVDDVAVAVLGFLSEGGGRTERGEGRKYEQWSGQTIHDVLLSRVWRFEGLYQVPEPLWPAWIMTAAARTHKAIRVIMPSISKKVEK